MSKTLIEAVKEKPRQWIGQRSTSEAQVIRHQESTAVAESQAPLEESIEFIGERKYQQLSN